MLPAPVVPGEEYRLHGDVVLGRFAVSVRQSCEPAKIHTHGQIHPLDVRRANPIIVRVAKLRFFLRAYYLGWRVACGRLAGGIRLFSTARRRRDG